MYHMSSSGSIASVQLKSLFHCSPTPAFRRDSNPDFSRVFCCSACLTRAMVGIKVVPSPNRFVVCCGAEDVAGERAEWRHLDRQTNDRVKVLLLVRTVGLRLAHLLY